MPKSLDVLGFLNVYANNITDCNKWYPTFSLYQNERMYYCKLWESVIVMKFELIYYSLTSPPQTCDRKSNLAPVSREQRVYTLPFILYSSTTV